MEIPLLLISSQAKLPLRFLSIYGKIVATKEYTIPKQGTYIVTFETNGGTAVTSQTIVDNGTATIPTAPTKEGYTFAGWCTDTGCTNSYDFSAAVTESITLYAKWTVNTYTVTFNTDGGSAVTSQTVNYNSTATTPTEPTKDGYTFDGWYTDEGCTTKYDFSTAVTKDITLYAKWSEITGIITDWNDLYTKLNDVTGDVGNVYVSGEFTVTSAISFSGTAKIIPTGSVTFTRNASYDCRMFELDSDANLTFAGSDSASITFDGASISSENPMIYSTGTLTLENCTLQNTSGSSSNGGAVYIESSGRGSFSDCTFESNEASSCGGAVYIKTEATGTFSNCTFNSNTASYYGGAVYIESSGTGSFSDCTFDGNSAATRGGAIDSSGTADITNCTFTSNKTTSGTDYGGAINIDSGTMTISSITCSGNTATTGNDIYNYNGTLNIGGTIGSSVDIYMYNTTSNTSQALVPVKGITLPSGTDTINVEMYSYSEGTTVLTQSDGMSNEEFAEAITCFTLTNSGYAIGSDGTAVELAEPTGTSISTFSALTNCLNSYTDSTATADIVITGDIEITDTIKIYCNVNINADTTGRTLSRGSSFTSGALFEIGTGVTNVTMTIGESGGTLTIDGNAEEVSALYSLIKVTDSTSNSTIKISKKAILQNSKTTATKGAAIYASGSTVIIDGGTVQNNNSTGSSSGDGGAIYATNFEMSSGSISGNSTARYGGGVYVDGNAKITGGTISNNTASSYGGGIYLVGVSDSSVSGVTFDSNTGTTRAGAIYVGGTSTVNITDCTFTDNVSANGRVLAFSSTGGTKSIGGNFTITNTETSDTDTDIVIYDSDGVLNISKAFEQDNQILLTLSTPTTGNQYITADDGVDLAEQIAKFTLQGTAGYILSEEGVLETE